MLKELWARPFFEESCDDTGRQATITTPNEWEFNFDQEAKGSRQKVKIR